MKEFNFASNPDINKHLEDIKTISKKIIFHKYQRRNEGQIMEDFSDLILNNIHGVSIKKHVDPSIGYIEYKLSATVLSPEDFFEGIFNPRAGRKIKPIQICNQYLPGIHPYQYQISPKQRILLLLAQNVRENYIKKLELDHTIEYSLDLIIIDSNRFEELMRMAEIFAWVAPFN